jgi:transcriptional regulator with XRE-family HTH domain
MLTGSDIKTVRERLDLTQKEFGILVGVRFGSERKLVGRWEREDEYPSWEMLRHIRTLVAVVNAWDALGLERPKLAEDLLEDIFRSSGAVPFRKNT